jgi:hypothetical protein
VKPGLNSLKNALRKAKENGLKEIFLENGEHTFDHKDEDGDDCEYLVIDFPITIIGESKDGCTIIGGLKNGVFVNDTKRNTMSNCQVSHSKRSGVFLNNGLITMNGSGTSIHNNVTGGGGGRYGLYSSSSSSSIHLVSPLTKESVSINNSGGGNYGGKGTIKTI